MRAIFMPKYIEGTYGLSGHFL